MNNKQVLFITGTRADFGKQKSLIQAVKNTDSLSHKIFATGMHVLKKYGYTVNEIKKSGFKDIYTYINQVSGEPMERILANTVQGLSRYVQENKPDLIVIHGDRVETLAGSIVGAFRNIFVGHIEGGEISGTIDESIRHSVSKLSHIHFVTNDKARERLLQLGERTEDIYVIGSPDIDIMLSKNLPELNKVKERYEIDFKNYAIAILHPVVTDLNQQKRKTEIFVDALLSSTRNFIVIHPNNDAGSEEILEEYERLKKCDRFKLYPSLRFEYFLRLLKESDFLLGNSSCGIHEAPVYGVPSINIGSRQQNRFDHESIIHVSYKKHEILNAINRALKSGLFDRCEFFGEGNSSERFLKVLTERKFWERPTQKQFKDITVGSNFFDLVEEKR